MQLSHDLVESGEPTTAGSRELGEVSVGYLPMADDSLHGNICAQLLVDLINKGAFGPMCGDADRVRPAGRRDGRGMDLRTLRAQADGELDDLRPGRSA
jgi:hypothetical protein